MGDFLNVEAVLLDAFAAGARPDITLPVDQWAELHMIIPKDSGAAEPGAYVADRTPGAREIMQALSSDDSCQRVVVRACSQIFKTQVALNWIGSTIDQTPSNLLVLLPTLGLAKRVSARISKTIAAVDTLREKVSEQRSRDAKNTTDTKEYPGGTMYIVTAGSAANLAEIPARYIYGDEVDRWPDNVGEEGDGVKLAENRTTNYQSIRKMYFSGTPTSLGRSRIDQLMDSSDCCVRKVPCPHCSEFIEIDWEAIRYRFDANGEVEHAWAVCSICAAEIDESAKAIMLPAGRYFPTRKGDGVTRGFHVPATLFQLGKVSWLMLAREYVAAELKQKQGDNNLMRVFHNTRLARSFKEVGERLADEVLRARAGGYAQRVVPVGGLVLLAAVDTQDDRLELMIVAVGRGLEMWVIEYHKIYGDTSETLVWDELDAYLKRPVQHASGQTLLVSAVAIDTQGHSAHVAYNFCRTRESRKFLAIRGDGQENRPIRGRSSLIDVNYRGSIVKQGLRLWIVGVHQAKNLLSARLSLSKPGAGFIHFPDGLPVEFFEHLTNEERVVQRTAKGTTERWVKVASNARNEPWDLLVYSLFAIQSIGLDKFNDSDWARVESVVQPVQLNLLDAPPVRAADAASPITTAAYGTVDLNGWVRNANR
jgi:phage terminase large subunit GpA-like protein